MTQQLDFDFDAPPPAPQTGVILAFPLGRTLLARQCAEKWRSFLDADERRAWWMTVKRPLLDMRRWDGLTEAAAEADVMAFGRAVQEMALRLPRPKQAEIIDLFTWERPQDQYSGASERRERA